MHDGKVGRTIAYDSVFFIVMVIVAVMYLALMVFIGTDFLLYRLTVLLCTSSLIIAFIVIFYPVDHIGVEVPINLRIVLDVTLLVLSLITLMGSISIIELNNSFILMYIFTVFILIAPGYIILTLISIITKDKYTFTEYITISHILTLLLISVIASMHYIISSVKVYENVVGWFVNITALGSIVTSVYNMKFYDVVTKERTCIKLIDIITLVFVTATLILVIGFNWIVSSMCCVTDYPRLYRMMLRFVRYGSQSLVPYPWSMSVFSIIHIYLGKLSPFTLFRLVSLGSLFLILSAYLFFKRILLSARASTLALILWAVGGGFGWMLLFSNSLLYSIYSEGLGFWIWLSYRPITIGFTLLFVLAYILLNAKRSLRYLVMPILVSLPFFHIPKYLLGVLLIIGISLIRNNYKQLYAAILASLISYFIALTFGLSMYAPILIIVFVSTLLFSLSRVREKVIMLLIKFLRILKLLLANKYIVLLLLSIILGSIVDCILYGFKNIDQYILVIMWTLFPVPPSIYAIILGSPLLIIILSLISKDNIKNYVMSRYGYILVLVVIIFLMARIITFSDLLGVYFFTKSDNVVLPLYYEKRILALAYPFLIVLIVPMVLYCKSPALRMIHALLIALSIVQLPIYVLSYTDDIEIFSLNESEMNLVNMFINKYYAKNNYTILAAPGLLIRKLAYIPPTAFTSIYNDALFLSSRPETLFYLLTIHRASTTIYVIDSKIVDYLFRDSYVYNKIIPYLSSREYVGGIVIYKQLVSPVPPSRHSVLVALDSSVGEVLGYIGLNYTMATSIDYKLFRGLYLSSENLGDENIVKVYVDYRNVCKNPSATIEYMNRSVIIRKACLYNVNNTYLIAKYLNKILRDITGYNIYLTQVKPGDVAYRLPYMIRYMNITGKVILKTNHLIIRADNSKNNVSIIVDPNITVYCDSIELGKGLGLYTNISCSNAVVRVNNTIVYEGANETGLLIRGGAVKGEGRVCIRDFKILPVDLLPRYLFSLFNIRFSVCYNGSVYLEPVLHGNFLLASKATIDDLFIAYTYRYIIDVEVLSLIRAFILGLPIVLIIAVALPRTLRPWKNI